MSALLEELNVIDYELIVAVCPVIRVKQRIEYSPRPFIMDRPRITEVSLSPVSVIAFLSADK